MNNNGKIMMLPPDEARKIAAGEVIDKPCALVRELMDNAIDSGAATIEVSIEEGGIRLVEVSDDGSGMSREDLRLSYLPHATSKIRGIDDLKTARTLGFRGEALSSVAAVSRLEIVTSADGIEGSRLFYGPAGQGELVIENARRIKGSSVRSHALFETIPVRKRFLKREGSEAQLCRQIFIDKALAFPSITFRYIQDGKLVQFLPAADSYKARFAAAIETGAKTHFLHEIAASGEGFSIGIVVSGPELFRNDRRQQYVFANGRRLTDFSMLQALEYGTQGVFPNGTHSLGALFIDIDPALADFNIHPAKREARLSCSGEIHRAVTTTLRSFFRQYLRKNNEQSAGAAPELIGEEEAPRRFFGRSSAASTGVSTAAVPAGKALSSATGDYEYPASILETTADDGAKLRYIGRVFSLFILVEKDEKLFIIDQHAAHERILYDRLLSRPIPCQELLVPIHFTTDSAQDDDFLEREQENLKRLGIVITGGTGNWQIEALPELWRLGDTKTVEELLKLREAGENIAERWAATIVCHAACKDGDILGEESARSLAEKALALPVKRCPHGRPVMMEITRESLLKAVKRL
jgi:DNA mismatch repair protein MutL